MNYGDAMKSIDAKMWEEEVENKDNKMTKNNVWKMDKKKKCQKEPTSLI